jgi:ABC-2 type transport system permease protein
MLLAGGLVFALQPAIADMIGVDVMRVLDVDFGALSMRVFGWFLVYFLLGFALYGALYAGVGSLVSRQEEVSQATAPMTTVLMIGYFLTFVALGMPDSTLAVVMNLVPLTAPFVGMPRVVMADAPLGESLLSVALLGVAAAGALWLAGRLYRVGVLMYGQRPSWRRVFRIGGMQEVSR